MATTSEHGLTSKVKRKPMLLRAKTTELTELLFQHGMNPDHPNWLRVTPLHDFAMNGDIESAELFLSHGVNTRDEEYYSTPLGWAARCGKQDMVEFLLGRGAKTNLPDDKPWATPLAWAEKRVHKEIAGILRTHGAKA